MEELRFNYQQVAIYAVVINVVIGALFGLFPLLTGIKLNNRKYGLIAFIGAPVLGVIGIVLSFPFAMVMHWLILRNASASVGAHESHNTAKTDRPETDLTLSENS